MEITLLTASSVNIPAINTNGSGQFSITKTAFSDNSNILPVLFFSIILNTEHLITQRSMIYLSDLYMFTSSNNQNSKYLVVTLMSMAGLPPLGGFVGKLFLYFATI